MNPEQNPQQSPRGPQFVNYGSDTQEAQRPISVTPPSATYRGNYSAPKKSRKGLFVFLFILIIVILAIAYGAYAWVLRPDNTVKTIFNNITSADIISTNIQLKATSAKGDQYTSTILVDLDKTNPNSIKNQATIDINGDDFALGLELRYLNNRLYGQVTNYPKEYESFVKSFVNKWYSLTLSTGQGSKPINTDNLYEQVIGSGAFTGMHFAGFAWDDNGLVRKYTIDVNPEIFNNSVTSKYGQNLSASSIPYAGVASSYVLAAASGLKITPITISVSMFGGSLKQISVSATEEKSSAKTDIVLKYDDSKSEISIDTPSGAQSLEPIIAGFLNPTPTPIATTTKTSTTKTKAKK